MISVYNEDKLNSLSYNISNNFISIYNIFQGKYSYFRIPLLNIRNAYIFQKTTYILIDGQNEISYNTKEKYSQSIIEAIINFNNIFLQKKEIQLVPNNFKSAYNTDSGHFFFYKIINSEIIIIKSYLNNLEYLFFRTDNIKEISNNGSTKLNIINSEDIKTTIIIKDENLTDTLNSIIPDIIAENEKCKKNKLISI